MTTPSLFQSAFNIPSLEVMGTYNRDNTVTLHHGDAQTFLQTIPDSDISLIVTSPPYNIGKIYERKQGITTYLEEQEKVISELVRVLADQGNICWQTGNYVDNGEVFPLDMFYYPIFKKHGLKLRNRIIWRFDHGLHASKRFSGRYETILWFIPIRSISTLYAFPPNTLANFILRVLNVDSLRAIH